MLDTLLISILGLLMGLVSSISGGAGVFAIPTLLAFGIPPVYLLTTKKSK